MRYFLQENFKQERLIIDIEQNSNCGQISSVDAENWILAKRELGFELTGVQIELLEHRKREFNKKMQSQAL